MVNLLFGLWGLSKTTMKGRLCRAQDRSRGIFPAFHLFPFLATCLTDICMLPLGFVVPVRLEGSQILVLLNIVSAPLLVTYECCSSFYSEDRMPSFRGTLTAEECAAPHNAPTGVPANSRKT